MSKQLILVTGASSGIGKATAMELIKQGHVVYGAARRVEKMQDLVEAGGHVLEMDLTDHDSVVQGVKSITNENHRIDVLINNAGYAVYGAIEDITIEEARRQFEVNLFGVAALTKQILPFMREQGSGKIINVSSIGGKMYTPLGAWYHATKHALEGWSDCLRLETRHFGIDVVIIEPGAIATEFGDVMNQPMIDRSAGGPYEKLAQAVAAATKGAFEKGGSSSPSVIVDLISKAIVAKKPKTRYVAGKYAKPMLWMRKWLSDRAFDNFVMSTVKKMG